MRLSISLLAITRTRRTLVISRELTCRDCKFQGAVMQVLPGVHDELVVELTAEEAQRADEEWLQKTIHEFRMATDANYASAYTHLRQICQQTEAECKQHG